MNEVGAARPVAVATASVRGASHRRRGRPNQDAVATSDPHRLPLVVGVSDGHGSDRSPHSDRGSRFAVDLAVEVLGQLAARPDGAAAIVAHGMTDVWRRWVEAVRVDAAAHRPPDAAADAAELLAYGATLLAVVVTPGDEVVYLQLGDGDLVEVDSDGQARRGLPDDDLLDGTLTTSLCLADAPSHARCRRRSLEEGPVMLLLSTDGYSNSFADDEGFLEVGGDLLGIAREQGVADLQRGLPGWLAEASEQGSGDDVTAAVVLFDGEGDGAAQGRRQLGRSRTSGAGRTRSAWRRPGR